jgi:hypothetical protein
VAIEEFVSSNFQYVQDAYMKMKELYTQARRDAYGVEQTLDALLERLA